jgi:hypothetical protein
VSDSEKIVNFVFEIKYAAIKELIALDIRIT